MDKWYISKNIPGPDWTVEGPNGVERFIFPSGARAIQAYDEAERHRLNNHQEFDLDLA